MNSDEWPFTEDDLWELAGDPSYERGLGYVDGVTQLVVGAGTITASVRGEAAYRVVLTIAPDADLDGECTCPYGQEGNFCKHCVAVGLAVLRQGDVAEQISEARNRDANLNTWLESLPHAELLALLREQLAADSGFRRRLELRSAATDFDLAAMRREINGILDPTPYTRYGCMDYSDVIAFATHAREAVPVLTGLVEGGRAADAVELARDAVRRVEGLYEEADDSSGALGGLVTALLDLHLTACAAARPDPAATANWLVEYVLGDYASDAVRVHDYRDVLGTSGLAAVRDLAEAAVRRNPGGWSERSLLEDVLKSAADIDARAPAAAAAAVTDLGAGDTQQRRLADLSGPTHPAQALAAYLRLIEPYKQLTGDAAYEELARLLAKARQCHEHLGTLDEFTTYMTNLRATQRRKRDLMATLDRHGL